MKKTRMSNDLS